MTEPRDHEHEGKTGPPLGGRGGADDTDFGTDIGGVGATIGTHDDESAPRGRWTEENPGRDRRGALGSTRPGTESMGAGDVAGAGRLGGQSQTPGGGKTGGRQGAIRGDSGLDAMSAGMQGEGRTGAGTARGSRGRPDDAEQGAGEGRASTEMGGGQSAHGSSYGGTESLAGGSRETRRGITEAIGPSDAAGAERASEEMPQGSGEAAPG